MWNQGCSQSSIGTWSYKAAPSKKAHLEIFPCTVSQLLAADQLANNCFTICDCELNQCVYGCTQTSLFKVHIEDRVLSSIHLLRDNVIIMRVPSEAITLGDCFREKVSIVGIIRGFAPFVTNVQYSVDDMTGPPLNVKLWANMEDYPPMIVTSPGTYVKVIGSLRSYSGQRSLLAMTIRRVKDPNEISSHMLEVVQAHMQLFRKVFDVNMNATVVPEPEGSSGMHPRGVLPNGLSTVQGQVLHVIKMFSVHDEGISFHDLRTKLDYINVQDIRSSLAFLINEGHIFSTIDDHHFKAA